VPKPDIIRLIQSDADTGSSRTDSLIFSDEALGKLFQSDKFLQSTLLLATQPQFNRISPKVRTDAGDANSEGTFAQKPAEDSINILMLSGGGQWGAFGAGFLEGLNTQAPTEYPRFHIVSGISTGALQALFVGAQGVTQAQDAGKTRAHEERTDWLAELRKQYSPDSESEIVNRRGYLAVLTKGAIAGLKPLRKRIEAALCGGVAEAPKSCPLIDALADDRSVDVMIGFVEAESGKLQYVWANKIAQGKLKKGPELTLKEKQQCLTAAALASAAVPVYYQQIQIKSDEPGTLSSNASSPKKTTRTYMDGGIRQSVFFALPDALVRLTHRKRDLYIVRNGPTVAEVEDTANLSKSGISAGLRGYQLIVNQSEVASIAAMRPLFPGAKINLMTADGYKNPFDDPNPEIENVSNGVGNREQKCTKDSDGREGMMFDPVFMKCLRAYGRHKAFEPGTNNSGQRPTLRWIELPRSAPPTTKTIPADTKR